MAGLLVLGGCQYLTRGADISSVLTTDVPAKQNGQNGPRVSFNDIQAKDPQAKLGAEQHPKILAQFGGVYENRELETVLALITGRLVAQSREPNRAYSITVLNSPTVNAFALPGGYLYVTRGLLALANDSSEVAAVLAHEMAHVASNHGVERSRQAQAVDIAQQVAADVVSNPVVGQVAKASTERRLAAFSQEQELQADAVGIKMLGRAGFDPYAAARFLKSMDRFSAWRSADSSSGGNDMSSSHPSTPRRVELARRHARLIGPEGTGERNRSRYLTGINGLLFGDTAREGFIRGQKFLHDKLGIVFEVPDGFELSNRAKSVLASGPGQMALRFDAVGKEAQSKSPVEYLKSGWVNGLDPASVTALTVNGLAAARGQAEAGDWKFSITVVRYSEKMYRFILAAPKSETDVTKLGREIADSFRPLTKREISRLKPLEIKVVKVRSTDTVSKLAARMNGVSRKEALFKALNGIEGRGGLKGMKSVKLVED